MVDDDGSEKGGGVISPEGKITPTPCSAELSDEELLRYSRQILLPGFDVGGQEALRSAHVLVIGAGGLGSPVCLYLAAAGIGEITVIDHDTVDLSNLQRQIAHTTADIGRAKVESAADKAVALNPQVRVNALAMAADAELLRVLISGGATAAGRAGTSGQRVDCVLDCCDNFVTRAAVNRACHALHVPLVSGAAIRMEGQLAVFDFARSEVPCYACLYGDSGSDDLTCARNGVMAPVVGVIGSLQALAAIRVLARFGESAHGKLSLFDGMRNEWRVMRIAADPQCRVCGNQPVA
jgi:molybdopterin/thiamine biosynthesis adenylyltransferase